MSAGKVVMVIIGAMLALFAFGLVVAGGALLWAFGTQRTDDGFFVTPTAGLSTDTYALTSAEIDLGARPQDWFPSSQLATVRFDVESDVPVFVGIADEDDVESYLTGVGYAEVTRIGIGPSDVTYLTSEGSAPETAPADESFWVASDEGAGPLTLTWDLESGEWVVVIMNADGSSDVSVDVAAGARLGILLPIAIGLLVGGLVIGGIAAALLVAAVVRPRGTVPAVGAIPSAAPGPYPARLEGRLDPDLSRWMWLVKWFLAIPHYVVLAFLWTAFVLLTMVAWFAILFTGRYPKGIFDFNVGVLRWSWRVTFYSSGVLGSDRYPPFTLAATDYPAEFDVDYPDHLSRGLVLVKSWLLAIPHYLIVGLFTSGLVWWTTDIGDDPNAVLRVGGGIIGILVLIAAIALLFTGRYPEGLFDLVMGLHRWVFRVAAYAGLMRDEYPPFRLDIGGSEPVTASAESPPVAGGDTGTQTSIE